MRLCFIVGFVCGAVVPTAFAASRPDAARTVVRVDKRTNRLVRRVVVPAGAMPRVVAPKPAAPGETPEVSSSAVSGIIDEVSAKYGVDPLMVHSIIQVESSYDRFAVSPKGAQGLMQLIPSTARRFGVQNSFNSRENIEGGIQYLRHLLDRFDNQRYVFAAYNAGEEAVARYGGVPPYAETRDYVLKVAQRYGALQRAENASSGPSPDAEPSEQSDYRPLEAFLDDEGRLNLRTR